MRLILMIALFTYNAFILAGTAYLVQVYNWSPWWFLLSILLLMTVDLKEK